jgi:hypothetical protein
MKNKKDISDITKIKNFLLELRFFCNSSPSAQHLIYSKNGEVVMTKNRKNERGAK